MKKLVFAALAAIGMSFGAFAGDYVWTGAASDGKWSTKENWSLGGSPAPAIPGANDSASFVFTDKGQTLSVDVDQAVSLGKLRILGGTADLAGTQQPQLGTLTLTGEKITFCGESDGSNSTDKRIIYSSQTVVFDNLIEFRCTSPNASVVVWTEFLNATFNRDVTFRGNAFLIKTGRNYTARTVGTVTFNGAVTATAASGTAYVGDSGDPANAVVFNGKVTADNFGAGSYSGATSTFTLNVASNDLGLIKSGHAAHTVLGVRNALSERTLLSDAFNHTSKSYLSSIKLGANDQVANALTGWSAGRCTPDSLNYQVESSAPVTLTLKGSASAETGLMLAGKISVVWDPADPSYVQTFRNRTHSTVGSLTVKSGAIALKEATTFPNVTNVTIAADAALDATEATADNPFAALRLLTVGPGGKLVLPAGLTVTAFAVRYDGRRVELGTYSQEAGDGVKSAPWIEGQGQVVVTDYDPIDATWTGAAKDGKWSTGGNWDVGECPRGSEDIARFDLTADLTVDVDLEGVRMSRLLVTGMPIKGHALTITGSKLTLTGASTGTVPNSRISALAGSVLFGEQTVNIQVPVDFMPSDGCDVWLWGLATTFGRPVNFIGRDLYLKTGFLVDSAVYGVDRYTGNITFEKPVTATPSAGQTQARIGDKGDPSGTVHFYGKVMADQFGCGSIGAASTKFYLGALDCDLGLVINGHAGQVITFTEGAFGPRTVLSDMFNHAGTTMLSKIDLDGHSQTINRLSGVSSYGTPDSLNYAITSSSYAEDSRTEGRKARRPPVLTLKGTQSDESSLMISADISFVWDPTGDFTQTLRNRTHGTTGSITVNRGTLALTMGANFPNVKTVTVRSGATLDCSGLSSGVDPFPGDTIFVIERGGAVKGNGMISAGQVVYDGNVLAPDTYTEADWLKGSGAAVRVKNTAPADVSFWIGGSGDWESAANWAAGNVPGPATKSVIFAKAQATRATVTLNGSFETAGMAVSVGANYTVKVAEGATFYYNNIDSSGHANSSVGYTFDILEGGKWLNEGATRFRYFVGEVRIAGEVTTTDGTFVYEFLTRDPTNPYYNPIRLLKTGVFSADGGSVLNDGQRFDALRNEGGTAEFRNLANFYARSDLGDSLPVVIRGSTTFSGSTTIAASTGCTLSFVSDPGETTTLDFKDTAQFAANDRNLVLGGLVGSTVLMNWDTVATGGPVYYIGADEGVATATVGAGKVMKSHVRGIKVGSPTGAAASESGVEGRLICEGTANSTGTPEEGWHADWAPNGFLVGYGMGINGETTVTETRYFGRVDVPTGGTMYCYQAPSVIGAGYGEGEVYVTGGIATLPYTTYSLQNVFAYPPTVVGLAGGVGRVVVSNGTFQCCAGTLFLGGCRTDDVPVMVRSTTPPYVRGWNPPAGYLADRHDAQGAFTQVGGTVTLNHGLVMGADGTATLTLVGNNDGGTFTVNRSPATGIDFILSNSTAVASSARKTDAATIRWVANEDGGLRTITVGSTSKAVFTDGARLEVDLTKAKKIRGHYRLIAAATVEGFEDIPCDIRLPADLDVKDPAVECRPGDGIYLKVPRGMVMIVR